MMLNTYPRLRNKSDTASSCANQTKVSPSLPPLDLLLVDDNPINLQLLRRTLLSIVNVRHMDLVGSGQHALKLLEHHHYDAILLDIDMPGLNGVQTTELIRRRPTTLTSTILEKNRSIPIIAVTTSDSSEERLLYKNVGMDACLSKPIKVSQLKSQLLPILNQSFSMYML